MPFVTIEMLAERTLEQKRQLAADMTKAFVKIGIPAEEVQLVIRENPKSCWADAGKLCSDFEIPHGA